jgi:nicotinate phosphoribosyltransferase
VLDQIYKTSLSLLTDLYQLTMAYAFWKQGLAEREAVFHLYFRKNPFAGGFTIAAGLGQAIEYLERFRFDQSDLEYLSSLKGNDDAALFSSGFLQHLEGRKLTCDVDAVEEGTAVFPHEPLLRVRGPVIEAQLLETPLLNVINFQTLVATKAARVCLAAGDDPVIEFGLRRAQGPDGGISASRAAYIGGCVGTSNLLAGKLYGIPVRGTHAHSWVMFFDEELEAFETYAEAMPNNCVFLVDTYDSLQGVRRAIEVGQRLRSKGHKLAGVRLDSGDLAYLSAEARKLLDDAGFPEAVVVASNDLDESIIASLKAQGAKVGVWGVGTKLATAYDQPALGGVYKLSGVRSKDGHWVHRVKISEQAVKTSNPGIQQVRRYQSGGEYTGDAIWNETDPAFDGTTIIDPLDPTRRKTFADGATHHDLLKPIFRGGTRVYTPPSLAAIRRRVTTELSMLHPGIKRALNPHQYPVGLEQRLFRLRTRLVLEAKGIEE